MKSIFTAALFLTIMTCKAQDTSKSQFSKVDMEASFPGGSPGWNQFLSKNFRYPDEAVSNDIQGNIVVQFQIDEEGNVSDIKPISGPKKGGLREEAIRIIKISGKWEPAIRNNIKVKSIRKQTISFRIVK